MLRTNSCLPAEEVAVQYKRLLLVEQFFHATTGLLETRPIFHQWDATIRGHVCCSVLAMMLLDELRRRLATKSWSIEWEAIRQDLAAVQEVEVRSDGQWYLRRSALPGHAGKLLQAAGVVAPPPVRPAPRVVPKT